VPDKEIKLLHKRGDRAPSVSEIDVGEVAINTVDGELYVRTEGDQVVAIGASGGPGGGISEAPLDGKQYGRQDADWTEISGYTNIEGGNASSIYLYNQIIDGGSA
jgi:hypothetical protein